MDKEKILDIIIFVVIAGIGVFTAYITFGILNSQAQATIQRYSVGGAIAGALISWSLLTSLYLQIRQSSTELRELRKQNEELQQKLIRGTPHPPGFVIEISEQQKIVLARPEIWERRGGVVFDFELPDKLLKTDDFVPPRFTCSFTPIPEDITASEYYEKYLERFNGPLTSSYTRESVGLGGEPNSIQSLKVIAHEWVQITLSKNPITGKEMRVPIYIDKQTFERGKNQQNATDIKKIFYAEVGHMYVVCYHKNVDTVYFLEFLDGEKDFVGSSTIFNQIVNSIRFLL
jgi:hypothetical protein